MIDLRTERVKKGLSQAELARECGVVRQAISNVECGIATPSVKTAHAIGKVLGLDWTEFFSGNEAIINDGGGE